MQEDNIFFSITLATPWNLPTAARERVLIELDLITPLFTVPSPNYDADDDNEEYITSFLIEDIYHLTSLQTHLLAKEVISVFTEEINLAIHAIKSNNTTSKELFLGRFTCKKLKKIS